MFLRLPPSPASSPEAPTAPTFEHLALRVSRAPPDAQAFERHRREHRVGSNTSADSHRKTVDALIPLPVYEGQTKHDLEAIKVSACHSANFGEQFDLNIAQSEFKAWRYRYARPPS